MPKNLPEDLNDRLLAALVGDPDGFGMDRLLAALGAGVSRRTLQRRLNELTAAGRLLPNGQGRARVYRAVGTHSQARLGDAAFRQGMVEPDPFRITHRARLIELVGDVVRSGLRADERTVRGRAGKLVSEADLDRFVTIALNDLHHLHEGNVARYRLRLSEYEAWKKRIGTLGVEEG